MTTYESLLYYCAQFVSLNETEKELIGSSFTPLFVKRKDFVLTEGKICDFIAFVHSGIIRHYHVKEGNEITCDITLPLAFLTDFKSFTQGTPSAYYFQALKDAELLLINRQNLFQLYEQSQAITTLGRVMAEQVAQRTIDIAMSLASDKPGERVNKLLSQRADLFREVPQRYLANLLGISPESLSRIRARDKRKS